MYPDPSYLTTFLASLPEFVRATSRLRLRPYQVAPLASLFHSISHQLGDTIIIVFPRQSGKDEFLIQLMVYLLYTYQDFPVSLVAVNPTYKPQTATALLRFDQVISRNPLTARLWRRHGAFTRLVDQARISFLSGEPRSNVLGATASLLLILNEAQDILPNLYQSRFLPMTASTNATRLLAGTLWTSTSLLSREIRQARFQEEQDGRRRVFMVDADHVRTILPAYGHHVDAVVSRWGRDHPLVKTQYFNEELDAAASMFNPARLALMFPSYSPPNSMNLGGLGGVPPNPSPNVVTAIPSPALSGSPAWQSRIYSSPPINSVILSKAKDLTPSPFNFSANQILPSSPPINNVILNEMTACVPDDLSGEDLTPSPSKILANQIQPSSPPNTSYLGGIAKYPACILRGEGGSGVTAFLLDLAGQDEAVMSDPAAKLSNPARDAATLSIVSIDLSTVPLLNFPSYRIVHRHSWLGDNHLTIFADLKTLAEYWSPRHIVIDATGVGEGLWALLDKSFPGRVIPVKFTSAIKSEMGYRFLAMINTGRITDLHPDPQVEAQYRACQSEVLPGSGKTLRWGVPEGTRDEEGRLIHDDYIMADALATCLDDLDWSFSSPTLIIPLDQLDSYANTDLIRSFDRNY